MAFRQIGSGVEQGVTTLAHAAVGTSVGVVLAYTVPAGRNAMLRWYSILLLSGTPTIGIQVTVGGVTATLATGAVSFANNAGVALNSGDQVAVNVLSTSVGSSFDAVLSVEERSNA